MKVHKIKKSKMRLFVIGESTPNPEKWSIWSEYALVLARNENHAREITDNDKDTVVCEIPMNKPLYLVQMSEPSWGEDI